MSNSNQSIETEVCIIGAGFAGLNAARLLAKSQISSVLIDGGFGASNFWAGTVDTLDHSNDEGFLQLSQFQQEHKNHPYQHLNQKDLFEALCEFEKAFPSIKIFQNDQRIINRQVLTTLGNLKPTSGLWKTIFHQFDQISSKTLGILIEFEEFELSSMHLLAKGLFDQFPGNYRVLKLSLDTLFKKIHPKYGKNIRDGKISVNSLGKFFEDAKDEISKIAKFIQSNIREQIPKIREDHIQFYLFPPILGIENSSEIISNLHAELNTNVYEIISLSPSILANRLIEQYHSYIGKSKLISKEKGLSLINLSRNERTWKLELENGNKESKIIRCKAIIIACGSIFLQGIFESTSLLTELFKENELELSHPIGPNFEVTSSTFSSNLFIIGSALFHFDENLLDDDEINHGTGLGLAITSSYKVSQYLKKQFR